MTVSSVPTAELLRRVSVEPQQRVEASLGTLTTNRHLRSGFTKAFVVKSQLQDTARQDKRRIKYGSVLESFPSCILFVLHPFTYCTAGKQPPPLPVAANETQCLVCCNRKFIIIRGIMTLFHKYLKLPHNHFKYPSYFKVGPPKN